jgi:hypothetical protein
MATTLVDIDAIDTQMERQAAELESALRALEEAGERILEVDPAALRALEEAVARFSRDRDASALPPVLGIRV